MIQGVVNAALEALVTLTVQGPTEQNREIEAVVDTGFSGFLTLPTDLVGELGLLYQYRGRAILADGSEAFFHVYDVNVLWDNRLMRIETHAADTTPLVGMRLLDHHDLSIQVMDGGRVVIQAG